MPCVRPPGILVGQNSLCKRPADWSEARALTYVICAHWRYICRVDSDSKEMMANHGQS